MVRDYRESHRSHEKAAAYDREFHSLSTTSGVLWQIEQEILRSFLERHRSELSRSLDFACGTGRVLSLVSEFVPEAVGVDIAPEMLALASQRCPNARLVAADITATPDAIHGSFDLITAFRFFLEADDELRNQALLRLRALISPGGYLVVNFHRNPKSLRGAWLSLRGLATGKRYAMMSLDAARALLGRHGFEVVDIRGYAHLLYQSAPRGSARFRRAVDRRLSRVAALRTFGTSFLIVARPRVSQV